MVREGDCENEHYIDKGSHPKKVLFSDNVRVAGGGGLTFSQSKRCCVIFVLPLNLVISKTYLIYDLFSILTYLKATEDFRHDTCTLKI